MIYILEFDKRFGFEWRPHVFTNTWNGRRTRRIVWGWWSFSYYRIEGLKEFFRRIEQGNGQWMD